MKNSKKSNPKHIRDSAMEVDDGKSSSTAVTTDSDDIASDTMTLVDLFSDLAVGDLFEANNDNLTSADSSATPSSEVSTDNQSTPSADASGSEIDLKTSGKKNRSCQNQKKGKVSDTESDSGISADTSSAEAISSTGEFTSSQAKSAEVAMAQSITSGGATSNESSTSGVASPESGGASSSTQSPNKGHWTPSEDALIISMKEGGEGWASIGKAINRGKNEVKRRWHVAKANAANSESGGDALTETESEGENGQTASTADSKTDQSHGDNTDKRQEGHKADNKLISRAERKAERKAEQRKNKDNATSDDKTKEPKKSHPRPKQPKREAEEQQPSKASEAPSTPKPSSSNSVGDSPSSSLRSRLALLRDTTSASSSTSSATSNDGDGGDDASDSPAKCYHRELARQERYIRRHVNPALYPPLPYPLMPPPTAFRPPSHADKRQRRDDKILASLVSRREATKWLEMQANFYNVTGRMVPLHMIKARCEAEEVRSKVVGVRDWATSVADGDELLDPNEGADVPEDALVEYDEE
ncbi:hypothetical protein CGRA01v4_03250 [Colletotrichum graminicola]|uniref:Myb-like domain-containing protein n=1 Tax=Colletotrichum graminicola (strain M1.001 / M2 / FGSC 10212) TaxID=645133 RepID=E3QB14_COLGM|nr:uncharacterized protein GLRG_03196 [Colletotrichum graminicola M1.001]EFQ28052.1 hypothetical protein GLRG_03196 [Colletotrichum graminicola M1.001]WDK11971.1 hypothetical protein CGRA01v4_03250 [Colletotrichum graminicola]